MHTEVSFENRTRLLIQSSMLVKSVWPADNPLVLCASLQLTVQKEDGL